MNQLIANHPINRVIFAILTMLVVHTVVSSQTVGQVYQDIKQLEGSFPIPTSYATVTVGSLSAGTGKFTFASGVIIQTFEVTDETGNSKPPDQTKTLPLVEVNAVRVGLTFRVTGAASSFQATANGITVAASSGQTSVTVDVGSANTVRWSVRAGNRTYSDRLAIKRPPIVGGGVFTIPALPVAIIYEPPPDSQNKNKATYSVTRSIGTTVRMTFSKENSTTTPVRAQFDTVTDIQRAMNRVAAVIPPQVPYASQIASALKKIATGLGSVSASETTGTEITQDHALSIVDTEGEKIDTDPNDGGPGIGDIIYYLKNAKLVWLVEGGTLRLALLGYESKTPSSVKYLRTQERSLDSAAIDNLLRLDPFIYPGKMIPVGWQPQLAEPRFLYKTTYNPSGTSGSFSPLFKHQVTQSDLNATKNFTTRTEDYREGFLSFLGLGVTENKTLKATFTHSSSTENKVGLTAETTATFFANDVEQYAVEVYYDRLFGTFAFKKVPVSAEPQVSGRVMYQGRPMSGQQVTLIVNGKRFSTSTDREGRYEFRAASIKPGNGVLNIGNQKRVVRITAIPIRNVDFTNR